MNDPDVDTTIEEFRLVQASLASRASGLLELIRSSAPPPSDDSVPVVVGPVPPLPVIVEDESE